MTTLEGRLLASHYLRSKLEKQNREDLQRAAERKKMVAVAVFVLSILVVIAIIFGGEV